MEAKKLIRSEKEKHVYNGLILLRKKLLSDKTNMCLLNESGLQDLRLVIEIVKEFKSARCADVALSIVGNISVNKESCLQVCIFSKGIHFLIEICKDLLQGSINPLSVEKLCMPFYGCKIQLSK